MFLKNIHIFDKKFEEQVNNDKNDLFLHYSETLYLTLDNYLKYNYFLHKDDKEKQKKTLQQGIDTVKAYFKGSVLQPFVQQDIADILNKNQITP